MSHPRLGKSGLSLKGKQFVWPHLPIEEVDQMIESFGGFFFYDCFVAVAASRGEMWPAGKAATGVKRDEWDDGASGPGASHS